VKHGAAEGVWGHAPQETFELLKNRCSEIESGAFPD